MDLNEEIVEKHVIVETPSHRSEVVTERTEVVVPREGVSTGMIAIIAILAITVIGVTFYLVTNNNLNESANRNANLDAAASQAPPATIVQQPAPVQQAPLIIQQPAAVQQAPVIIQQPAPAQAGNTSANDDAAMQDTATRRLTEDPAMAAVVMTVTDARVVLTGSVNSAAAKAKAEQIVKGVRGVKSVDNQIVVMG